MIAADGGLGILEDGAQSLTEGARSLWDEINGQPCCDAVSGVGRA